MRFFNLIIDNKLDVKFFFPNGVRGDILMKDYIDLMIKAGTINIPFALETASPRLQRLIRKHVKLEKFRENIEYIINKYPHIILDLFTMHGFPSETPEEAMMTLDFIKSLKWLHFPYVFIVRIYPNTDMAKIAVENGVSIDSIYSSQDLPFHKLPDTLPFDRSVTLNYQSDFFNNYFLAKERLLHVLPKQMKVLTEDEIVQKYNSYLPIDINDFNELLDFLKIKKEELGVEHGVTESSVMVPNLNEKIRKCFPAKKPSKNALKILLLDLSQHFSHESDQLNDLIELPMGLMYLQTYLNQQLGSKVKVKIAKSQIDFNSYAELKALLDEFKPQVIGIRTLTFFKNFFHKTISLIRQWGIDVPIITGGPYATSDYQRVLQDRNIDLVVHGEGEITFCELVEKIIKNGGKLPGKQSLNKIPGISYFPEIPDSYHAGNKFAREIIMLDELHDRLALQSGEDMELPHHSSTDLAYIIFTSGSTGRPKGVPISHSNISPLLNWGYKHLGVNSTDRVIQNLSYYFDWSVWEIFITLMSGASLYIAANEILLDPKAQVDFMARHKITILHITPTHYRYIINAGQRMETLKYLFIGAEKLTCDLAQRSIESVKEDCRIYNMYGPTETTIISAVLEIDKSDNSKYKKLSSIPIGKPVGNTELLILDKYLKLCPVNSAGELYISGDGLAGGYLSDPEKTCKSFIKNIYKAQRIRGDRLYKTGDLARWLPDGTIEFLGRIDQQTKIRGFRIELGEIESQLLKNRQIKEAVVLVKKDKHNEKHLCAYIVFADANDQQEGTTANSNELREYLAAQLPDYMLPHQFVTVDRIPLTRSGKTDTKALANIGQNIGTGVEYQPPGNVIETIMVNQWKEVLDVDTVSINDDFFQLGGNSLTAIKLVSKLKDNGIRISVSELFRYQNIKEMAQYITDTGNENINPHFIKAIPPKPAVNENDLYLDNREFTKIMQLNNDTP